MSVWRTPVESAVKRTSNIVTTAIAAPRKMVLRRCSRRFKRAILASTKKESMASFLRLHRFARAHPGRDPRWIDARYDAHDEHDDQREREVLTSHGRIEPWPREEEGQNVARRGNAGLSEDRQNDRSERAAERAEKNADDDGLDDEHRQHEPALRADGAEHPDLAHPLERRHHQRVVDDDQRNDENDEHRREQHHAHQGRELPDETRGFLPGHSLERQPGLRTRLLDGSHRGVDLLLVLDENGGIQDDP